MWVAIFDYAVSGEYDGLAAPTAGDILYEGKCVILVSHSPDVANMCDERYELTKIAGKSKRK